jgi:hypothetical protein
MDVPPSSTQDGAIMCLEFELVASLMMTSIIGEAAAVVARRRRRSLIVDVGV